ncbi:MAG: hypothetical protein ACI97N_002533 [Cognaticolwellia sp.]|jgi:hypothetical protein
MSNILDLVQSQLSGEVLEQLANQIGGGTAETQTAIASAVPAMLQAMTKNGTSQDGATSFAGALEKDHDGSILTDLMGFVTSGNDTNGGSGILSHLFGQKKPNIENVISETSGLNNAATSNLMTQLAPIVMGFLGQQKKQGGLDVGGIASLVMTQLSGAKQNQKGGNSALDMITGLLDKEGDGVADDLMDIGKGLLGNLFGGKK